MLKKSAILVLALLLLLQPLSVGVLATSDSGSPKHIPRVVSIVFDDSGSMYKNTDRWAYTSYAMQSFAAMMGSEDVLYLTYINAQQKTETVKLNDSAKANTVKGFSKMMFGGGTLNKVPQAATALEEAYAQYKDTAKYYLVVMADGELDPGQGILAEQITTVTAQTKAKLSDADFKCIYFCMDPNAQTNLNGVKSYKPENSKTIVDALKDVSAEIMGRTELEHKVSGNTLSFKLSYPALSIAVFVQKANGNFDSFKANVKKDGAGLRCQVGNYPVICPTDIIKNPNETIYDEVKPTDPPGGCVSLITNSGKPLAKGEYTVDLSGYDLKKDDIVVLVEPAVRIGCKYGINDAAVNMTFEEMQKYVSEGDSVTVACGLYEMNEDGSLGDPVPENVLSPKYTLTLNDAAIGEPLPGKKNTYHFQVEKEHEDGELRIEAQLEGYQPFVQKETFGKLNIHIKPIPIPEGQEVVLLTKPLWKAWGEGKEGIRLELEKADAAVLENTAIEIGNGMSLPAGKCSALSDCVRLDGNTIVYTPKSETEFSKLPESFTVTLKDLTTGEAAITKTVKTVQPVYRFETENALAGTALSLQQLKENQAAISFTLTVDYDGSGKFIPVSESDCENEIPMEMAEASLPGETKQETGKLSYIPQYDQAIHTDIDPAKVLGASHSFMAAATVDGKRIESEKATLSLNSAAYRLEAENPITQVLSLDGIRENQKKIVFHLLADYDGTGNYGPLAAWDAAKVEQLKVTSGELPGKLETAYDAGGKAIGLSFLPSYDENNPGDVPFTAVAGRVHEIVCTMDGTDLTATTTVEISMPNYELKVVKDGIEVIDAQLYKNQEYVAFAVLRDGRPLTAKELEGLAPYDLKCEPRQSWIKLQPDVITLDDGTVGLKVTPTQKGWRILSVLCILTVKKGDTKVVMTLGEKNAAANVHVQLDEVALLWLLIILAIILLICWIVFCVATRIRFLPGHFYVASLAASTGTSRIVAGVSMRNANKKSIIRHIFSKHILIPFSEQKVTVNVGTYKATFVARKAPHQTFNCSSYPYNVGKANQEHFRCGATSGGAIQSIINMDPDYKLTGTMVKGKPVDKDECKLNLGDYLVTKNGDAMVFFVSKRERKSYQAFYGTKSGSKKKKKSLFGKKRFKF